MNVRSSDSVLTLSIAAVERDTGLSKDTLRVWERRYGFPQPQRDGIGERAYTLDEVDKLRIVKRLLDAGHRPGRIVPLPMAALQQLTEQTVDQPQRGPEAVLGADDLRAHLERVRSHDTNLLRTELLRLLARHGVARFVIEIVGPLNAAVGDAWIRGQLEVFEEHMYTEVMQGVLRQAIAGLPPTTPASRPRVLLSTFPGEPHGMGLLMAEAVLRLDGCHCVSLGTQTPLWDIVLAAQANRADVVGLSFTGCMNPNHVVDGLVELRSKLPAGLPLWVGGSAPVLHRRRLAGVTPFGTLELVPAEVQRWRASASVTPAAAG
ncbi:MAG: MerR family transcriptional regulator [Rubrivivax sp.]|nr:MerR family transcriptional regulator [Rubrivivax sp.]